LDKCWKVVAQVIVDGGILGKHTFNPERGNVYDSSSLESIQLMQKNSRSKFFSTIIYALIAIAAIAAIVYFVWPKTPSIDNNSQTDGGELTVTQITTLYNSGDFDKASTALAKYLASNPNDLAMRDMLASSYMLVGKNKEAISEYETLLKSKQNDADILYKIGVIKQRLGKQQEAIAFLQQASEAAPDVLLIKIELARANTEAKVYDNAIEAWKASLKLLPENDKARVGIIAELANIYLIKADFEKAKDVLEEGLAIDPDNATLKSLEIKSGSLLHKPEN
jgi:tetratricopeptide (TPR) repeat protein